MRLEADIRGKLPPQIPPFVILLTSFRSLWRQMKRPRGESGSKGETCRNVREPGSRGDHGPWCGFFTPNHNIPGPPPFRYFRPGGIHFQALLVLAAATAFIDIHNMARAQRLRADCLTTKSRLLKPVSRELKEKGHSHSGVVFCSPVLFAVLMIRVSPETNFAPRACSNSVPCRPCRPCPM